MENERLHIAVAVIFNNKQDMVLLAKRPDHVHQGGLWEFPGGKRRESENIREALKRELAEELGLLVDKAEPFMQVEHDYPELSVLLDVWRVFSWHGDISGREGQEIEWVRVDLLDRKQFPIANQAIVTAIQDSQQNRLEGL